MLFVIDVGNTNMTLGVCDNKGITAQWRLTTINNRTIDELGMNLVWLLDNSGFTPRDIDSAIISCVVPKLMYPLNRAINKYFNVEPLVVSLDLKLGLKLSRPASRELGADRLVTAAAGFCMYGGPVIVIDYGTATTYDVVSAEGEFITGITAPGVKISADALFEKAALLGEIELAMPRSIVASNTVESLQCGILYGCIGETEYITSRLKRELEIPDAIVVATGGMCRVIASGAEGLFDHVEPALILEGLRLIHIMNIG
jgi:type III pantothenate kinase